MRRPHVDVNRIQQQRRAVGVRIEPTLKRYLLKMLWLAGARLNLRLVHEFEVSLLPIVRFGADGGNVQTMGSLHVRSVVEAADECIDGNINSAFNVAVAPQREVGQP